MAVSGCQTTKRSVAPVRPDLTNPERFDCRAADTTARPRAGAEDPIDLDRAAAAGTLGAAMTIVREEVEAYRASVRAREGVVTRYVLQIEGELFECANDAQWAREFFARLPDPTE